MSTNPSSISIASPKIAGFSLFRQPEITQKPRVSQNRTTPQAPGVFEWPQLLSTPHSDRVAILDRVSGSYCAYSLMESVNQTGLNREEAEEWIAGQLLIKQNISPNRALQVVLMIAASWGCAALGIWSLVELFF